MTASAHDEMATVRDLIFGDARGEPTRALAQSMRDRGAVKNVAARFPGLNGAIEHEIAAEAGGALALNLWDLAVAGWKKYEEVRKAARRTLDAPPWKETVVMARHQIVSSHRPTIDLYINGRPAGAIDVELTVTFDMAGVRAVICRGRLTEIQSGDCTVTGTLAIDKAVVAKKQREFDLPGAVTLRHGVALVEPMAPTLVFRDTPARSAPAH